MDAANGRTRFAYDVADRLMQVTDPRGLVTRYVFDGFGNLWEQHSPDSGLTRFAYDAAGQRTFLTRADGSQLPYLYDEIGRLTGLGEAVQSRRYWYDNCTNGIGRLCQMASYGPPGVTNWTQYTYTPWGAASPQKQSVHGAIDTTTWSYDNLGRVAYMWYPSGLRLRYVYANGALKEIRGGSADVPVVTGIQYAPFGPATGWDHGNGLSRSHTYDLDGRVTAISARTADAVRQSLTYQYDSANRIKRITHGIDANLTHDFGYDALDRLTTAAIPSVTVSYGYDAVGNRTSHAANGESTAYGIASDSNRTLSMGGGAPRTYDFNGNGNVTRWTGDDGVENAVVYDAFNRVASHERAGVQTVYEIDAADQRIGKSGATTGTRRYIRAGTNVLAEVGNTGGWTNYIWLGGELVGIVRDSSCMPCITITSGGRRW